MRTIAARAYEETRVETRIEPFEGTMAAMSPDRDLTSSGLDRRERTGRELDADESMSELTLPDGGNEEPD